MASGSSYTDMEEEANCSICWEFLTDPVTLDCGHNFCRRCITRYRETWEGLGDLECPVCKAEIQKGNFRTNWQLGSLVKKVKEKRFHSRNPRTEEADDPHQAVVASRKGRLCQNHQEPLELFCKEDEALICVDCVQSREHRDHKILPLEEASQEYKDQFCNHLEILKKERERIMGCKTNVSKESEALLKQTTADKQKAIKKFRELHSFLEEQEKLLLAQLEELEKEVATTRDQHLAELSEALSSLDSLIQEMQEKCQQPASDLLRDARSTLQRYEEKKTFENPVTFPYALKKRISDYSNQHLYLERIMKQITYSLDSGLQLQKGSEIPCAEEWEERQNRGDCIVAAGIVGSAAGPRDICREERTSNANVTLDPDTAHPWLILSEDWKSMRQGEKPQTLPNNPERFDRYRAVLGCEGFTGGLHFWEVLVGSEGGWAMGVAKKSAKRKGNIIFSPEEGIWVVRRKGRAYWAARGVCPIRLSLSEKPKRIRVCLNYDGGQVAFFNADQGALIHEYSEASFSGETLLPFFYVYGKGHLKLC